MSDTCSSSSLAITEKKTPHRSGGSCIGILFHLLDWNRKLAKKKLFSNKLLPPARAKRASQKFGSDDKLPMPKLLLIADENRGGFPKTTSSETSDNVVSSANPHEMKSPSLVARLMGLDSMPPAPARRIKPQKPDNPYHETPSSIHNNYPFEKQHLKLDSRPQKLQKTGLFQSSPVTRFGVEALQFKSRKNHHPKLASPVKTSKVGRNTTRLMEAATKILEPGVHATQRAKSALTLPHKSDHKIQPKEFCPLDSSTYYATASKSIKGQPSSNKSCGNWLDVVDRRPNVEQPPPRLNSPPSDLATLPPRGSGRGKMKSAASGKMKSAASFLESQQGFVSFRAESKANIQKRTKKFTERKPAFQEYQHQHSLSRQRTKFEKDVPSVTGLKQKIPRKSHIPSSKDRGNPSLKYCNLNSEGDLFNVGFVDGTNDFVALNRNSSGKIKTRLPSKVVDSCRNGIERNVWEKKDHSPSRLRASVRKRRPTNGTVQVENTKFNQTHFRKQRDSGGDISIGEVMGSSIYSKNQNRVKTEHPRERLSRDKKVDAAGGKKDDDAISFTFSSPMRHKTESFSPTVQKTRGHVESMDSGVSMNKKLTSDANSGKSSLHSAPQLRVDVLGAFLQEKLRELTSQDRDVMETGDLQGRSTASILEELIYAFTVDMPSSPENGDKCLVDFSKENNLSYVSQDQLSDIYSDSPMLNVNQKLQRGAKASGDLFGFALAGDWKQPSPGSVLEASFSNESCFSESLDGCSGYKPHPESIECSYDEHQPPDLDADLSDSATSVSTRAKINKMTYSLSNISSVLYGIDPAEIGLVGSELNHAWEVIVDAELVLGKLCGAHSLVNFSIGSLLDKMETLSDELWSSTKCSMGFSEAKTGLQLRRFLLDCLIECLESKYSDYLSKYRFSAWQILPSQINGELLIRAVLEEVRRWLDLAANTADEIIERELSRSLGKWTGFEAEAFELGVEIEWDILEGLVDEVAIDLRQCRSFMAC